MWTANIQTKDVSNGIVTVGVLYSDGLSKVLEGIDMTGGDIDTLEIKIQSRLDTLNANDALLSGVILGSFASTAKPNTALQDFQLLVRNLRSATEALNLGIISNTDKAYTDALAATQAAFDPLFIGKF